VLKLIHTIVAIIEFLYQFLVESLWRELIEGEKNVNQPLVLFSFSVFVVFAVVAFYLESFVDILAMLAVFSFLFTQIESIKQGKLQEVQQTMEYISFVELMKALFHSVAMITFLLIISHFLPRAGHFIMVWVGPYFHLSVAPLTLDLSMSGIWSLFSFELTLVGVLELLALVTSTLIALFYLWKVKS